MWNVWYLVYGTKKHIVLNHWIWWNFSQFFFLLMKLFICRRHLAIDSYQHGSKRCYYTIWRLINYITIKMGGKTSTLKKKYEFSFQFKYSENLFIERPLPLNFPRKKPHSHRIIYNAISIAIAITTIITLPKALWLHLTISFYFLSKCTK